MINNDPGKARCSRCDAAPAAGSRGSSGAAVPGGRLAPHRPPSAAAPLLRHKVCLPVIYSVSSEIEGGGGIAVPI